MNDFTFIINRYKKFHIEKTEVKKIRDRYKKEQGMVVIIDRNKQLDWITISDSDIYITKNDKNYDVSERLSIDEIADDFNKETSAINPVFSFLNTVIVGSKPIPLLLVRFASMRLGSIIRSPSIW